MPDNDADRNMKSHIQRLEAEVSRLQGVIAGLRQETRSLRADEAKYAQAFLSNQFMIGIFRFGDGVIVDVNDSYARAFGYSREDLIGHSPLELGLWGDLQDRQALYEHLDAHGSIGDAEYEFRTRTGEKGYTLSSLNLMEIDGVKCILVSSVDITRRRQAEEAVDYSYELLYQVFNSIPMPIIIVSAAEHRIVAVNEAFLNRNKRTRAELIGKNNTYWDYWTCPEEMAGYMETIRVQGSIKNFETTFRLPSGEARTVLLSGVAVNWKGEPCVLSLCNDISDMRKYEQELARLDNLHLIGQMAASLAHEIRNPMTTIRGFLQLFQELDRFSEDKESFDLVIEELDRVNDIITSFLSLAQKNMIDPRLLNLSEVAVNLLPLIRADAMKNGINIATDIHDSGPVLMDEGEVRQVLLNLVRNAMDAMPQGGTVTIRIFEDPEGVNLLVEDHGHGIPPHVLENIAVPFFTTKDSGTGLGLPVCYSIAERHKSRIIIDTSAVGTKVRFIFQKAQ